MVASRPYAQRAVLKFARYEDDKCFQIQIGPRRWYPDDPVLGNAV